MTAPTKSVLWVDDEAEMLEAHRIFLQDKGYEVEMASNATDALERLRTRRFDVLLLDEQMPGKRGLEAWREVQTVDPQLPVVMITKSEEDATLREALGAAVHDYLVKPVNPRQVLTAITRLLDGQRLRQQAVAQEFVQRFREVEIQGYASDWRGWIERTTELVRWDVALEEAGELGLRESLTGLYPAMRRDFAHFIRSQYPEWLRDLQGDRPPLSIDIVAEHVAPVLAGEGAVVFIVVDCLRLDQWQGLAPLLHPWFTEERLHYYSILPTATPYSRNALFSGLFPGELAGMHPDWWREREDESLNAHERQLLELQLNELGHSGSVRYQKISTPGESEELEKKVASAVGGEGTSAFVFNFVDLLTHSRTDNNVLYEVAKDEVALRRLTKQWFERSAIFAVLKEAARRGITVVLTSDHGSILCQTPATVYARRDATTHLRYKFGEDLRAEKAEQALLFPNSDALRLPRRGLGKHTLLAASDCYFVYPTKLREYQGRYRGGFFHGGVSPEEMILPLVKLVPRR
jgi:DNA-binding response OmpR family regulator